MVPLLFVELDGAGATVDSEPQEVADPSNRPGRSDEAACGCGRRNRIETRLFAGGGPIVPGEEGLLDLLRLGEGGTTDSAVQVYGRCEQRASRMPAHVVGGELRQGGRRNCAQVQGLRCPVRD